LLQAMRCAGACILLGGPLTCTAAQLDGELPPRAGLPLEGASARYTIACERVARQLTDAGARAHSWTRRRPQRPRSSSLCSSRCARRRVGRGRPRTTTTGQFGGSDDGPHEYGRAAATGSLASQADTIQARARWGGAVWVMRCRAAGAAAGLAGAHSAAQPRRLGRRGQRSSASMRAALSTYAVLFAWTDVARGPAGRRAEHGHHRCDGAASRKRRAAQS
jgi:hypothetical protein